MGVGQKKNARNSPIGRVTKGDHLLWSDLHYILLQNRPKKVKLFFSPEEPPGPVGWPSEGGKEASGGAKQLDRDPPAGYSLWTNCFVYLFAGKLV